MSYQEKKTITSLIVGIAIIVAYIIYINVQFQKGNVDMAVDMQFWATSMLIFIGLGILLHIVGLIVFVVICAIFALLYSESS